ncbi:YidC/Oxa1 family membrane protein insertase [Vagococcus teuberi]|uniref:Membrane insertase YidC/Oxa/ALB C-terminal domain-containing protein n=1 Tax=Vagococcus teuberi TaxID=519472 RepID=A0A1J0A5E2_9ENTE|nr:YidC/Oxa1 family membrane protein insertase [Vagococcus teuberi]APB31127.1 hypothetical protein BHY08_04340 [Vagococcus teuberi]
MKNLKRWMIGSGLFGMLIFLSGCVKTDSTGTPTGEGIIYNLLVKPMSHLITFFAENWGLGFGWSIILLTMIVRLIILPLGLNQMKKSMIQQEKMAAIKPHMDVINEKMKTATTPEDKMAAQQELQQFYKDKHDPTTHSHTPRPPARAARRPEPRARQLEKTRKAPGA